MKATLLLADSAQADPAGKVHSLGLGWTVTTTPTPPASIVLMVDVPWDQCNTQHSAKIELVDTDGHLVALGQGPLGQPVGITIEFEFEVGRPAGLPKGSHVRNVLCMGIGPGVPLQPGQSYEYRLEINGDHQEDWSARFFVLNQPAG